MVGALRPTGSNIKISSKIASYFITTSAVVTYDAAAAADDDDDDGL